MLIKVKVSEGIPGRRLCLVTESYMVCSNIFVLQTLTGKEIEIDIEPTDKVCSIVGYW